MGLNTSTIRINLDRENYALSDLDGNRKVLLMADVIGSDSQVPFVKIGQVSEREFKNAVKQMELCGLHYSYDKAAETLSVAYSPEGRPAFERPDAFRAPDYTSLRDCYRDTAAHTIAAFEAKHILEDRTRTLRSGSLRAGILYGYREIVAKCSPEMKGLSDIEISRTKREIAKHPEKHLFTQDYEKGITKERDVYLSHAVSDSKNAARYTGYVK